MLGVGSLVLRYGVSPYRTRVEALRVVRQRLSKPYLATDYITGVSAAQRSLVLVHAPAVSAGVISRELDDSAPVL